MGPLLILLTTFLWSFVPFLTKETLPYFAPEWIATMRLLAGGLALLPFAFGAHLRPGPRALRLVLLGGAVGIAGNYVFYSFAIRWTTPSAGNVLVQIEVIGLVILGVLLLRESLGPLKIMGTLLALLGVFLVAWRGETLSHLLDSRYFRGNMVMLLAGLSWSWYGLAQKVVARYRPGAAGAAVMIFTGGVMSAVFALSTGRPFAVAPAGLVPWLELAALALACTGAAYLFFAWGIARMEASSAAMITTTLPVFTIIESWLLRFEPITGWLLVGAALVVAGVLLVVWDTGRRNHEAAAGARRV